MRSKTLRIQAKCTFAALALLGVNHLQAQTLKHSYTFEDGTYDISAKTVTDVAGTLLGTPVNGTINGNDWEIKNGYFYNHNSNQASGATMGAYISFDGTALALNSYSAVTIEAYLTTSKDQNNPNKWSMLAYFGGASGANSFMLQPEINGSNTKAGLNNSKFAVGAEAGPLQTHHYVAVLTPSTETTDGSIALYYDGALAQSTVLPANTYNTAVSSLATNFAYLCKSAWNDPLFTQPIHEFNIYDGVMDAATVAARYTTMNTKLATLTVDAAILSPAFDANIYNYGMVIPAGTSLLSVGATAVNPAYTVSGTGNYDVSGAQGTIRLLANAGGTPYTIFWRKEVATPLLMHSYTFSDGSGKDVVGGADGTLMGAGTISNGLYSTNAATSYSSGTSQYISLPGTTIAVNQYPAVTFESVAKTSVANFYGYFGNQTKVVGIDYLFLHTKDLGSSCNINHQPWNMGSGASGSAMSDGSVHHVVGVVTMDTLYIYQDGAFKAKSAVSNVNRLFNVSPNVAYIGRSGFPGDANFLGSIGEFNIWKGRLSAETIASRATAYLKDASLSALSVSVGTLTFNPATTSYQVTLPSGTSSVDINATAAKDYATVTGLGTVDVSSGSGTATIGVTSADASVTGTYTINFTVGTPTEVGDLSNKGIDVKLTNGGKIEVTSTGNGRLVVYNSLGQQVLTNKIVNPKTIIDIDKAGVYFVTVKVDGKQVTRKVIL